MEQVTTGGIELATETWIALGAVLVSLVSMAAAIGAWRAARRARTSNAAADAAPAWSESYFEAVREWADRACRQLNLAMNLAQEPSQPNHARRVAEVKLALVHLLDTGRWYFPNVAEGAEGAEKPPAYRGEPQPVLDLLRAAHELTGQADPVGAAALERAKGEFVSHIQAVLNPATRKSEIEELPRRFGAVRRSEGRLG